MKEVKCEYVYGSQSTLASNFIFLSWSLMMITKLFIASKEYKKYISEILTSFHFNAYLATK